MRTGTTLTSSTASAEWVYSMPWQENEKRFCAVPVVEGRFWTQTSGPERAVISLDISDPTQPREVSRLTLGANDVPHWIALEPHGDRLVITGCEALESRVLLARLIAVRERSPWTRHFRRLTPRSRGSISGETSGPMGGQARAIPHGAVFSRP